MVLKIMACPSSRRLRNKVNLLIVLAGASVFLLHWITLKFFCATKMPLSWEPIDVVYTWVNGSDPHFIESVLKWSRGDDLDPKRFDNKNELKYSLRSLERFAPWVRHIYIVANEIPNWLDLNNDRVSIVPHEELATNLDFLPTFSSNAIETFLHRIPKLSKRFLYFNDDIFLGAPLYPQDLYTESEGVQIYQSVNVFDCAEDCPWDYIGDDFCDLYCNITECQFDGGDCLISAEKHNLLENKIKVTSKNHISYMERSFSLQQLTRQPKYIAILKELMRQQNFSTITELKNVMETFEKQLNISSQTTSTTVTINARRIPKMRKPIIMEKYTSSAIFTNILLNRHYGFEIRQLIAHVAYFLDRNIIDDMQATFPEHILRTASHRFRAVDDLQFQLAYYYFLMNENITLSVEQVFDEFDTDGSGTWSDSEVRTFLTQIFPVFDWHAIRFFEHIIENCTLNFLIENTDALKNVSNIRLSYELLENSNWPIITRELVSKCSCLAAAITEKLATRPKYKYKINPKKNNHSNYMALYSNISLVTNNLDRIRRQPRKFNCINDLLDPAKTEDNKLIKILLEDFYISFFPRRSQFELPANSRNSFSSWREYKQWHQQKHTSLLIAYFIVIVLIFVLLKFFLSIRKCL